MYSYNMNIYIYEYYIYIYTYGISMFVPISTAFNSSVSSRHFLASDSATSTPWKKAPSTSR